MAFSVVKNLARLLSATKTQVVIFLPFSRCPTSGARWGSERPWEAPGIAGSAHARHQVLYTLSVTVHMQGANGKGLP